MRQIFLDTETTGLDPRHGHRIIEVACIEMESRRLTGRHLHKYINPEREIDEGAAAVHGITLEFLADKPKFADVIDEFLDFINGAELIIHNAPFDLGFLNAELARLDRVPVETLCNGVTDTLKMARDLHPGKRNSLDALCERYEIDNSQRTLHGALLDTELLSEVFLAMTRGQNTLMIEPDATPRSTSAGSARQSERKPLLVRRPSAEELAEHQRVLAAIDKETKGGCLWLAGGQVGGAIIHIGAEFSTSGRRGSCFRAVLRAQKPFRQLRIAAKIATWEVSTGSMCLRSLDHGRFRAAQKGVGRLFLAQCRGNGRTPAARNAATRSTRARNATFSGSTATAKRRLASVYSCAQ